MKTNLLKTAFFAFCCVFIMSSCDKEENEPAADGSLYFEAEMDGKSLLLPEGKDGYVSTASRETITNTSGCVEIQSMGLAKANDSKKSIDIYFVKQQSSCSPDCAKSKAILETGDYTYGSLETYSDVPVQAGVVIRYTDIYGKVWSTDYSTATQSNSNFSVTKTEANTTDNASEMLATATFNCILYDDEGNEIEITNGTIVSRSIVCE